MATIEYRLSSKIRQDWRTEIMIRFFHGKAVNQSAGTEVFVNPDFFEYYIDKAKTEVGGIKVPSKADTATLDETNKLGFVLRNSGTLVVSNRRLRTPDVVYHEEAKVKIDALTKWVLDCFNETRGE